MIYIASFAKKFFIIAVILSFFFAPLPVNRGLISMAQAFSVGEEREVGEKLLSIVRKQFKILDDPDISEYVDTLGRQIVNVAGSQFFDYHFFVIDNKEFNAFAAPSGLIFIHSGLIESMDNEGELLGVLAHECGHVTSRHIADRINKNTKLNIGTVALVLAGLALGTGPLAEALVFGSLATNATLNLKFSRQDEEEADRLAFNWMQDMRRDPETMASMLRKMRKISILQQGNVPPYLLTHPEPGQRLSYVQDLMFSSQGAKYPKTDDFDFQRFKIRVLSQTKEVTALLPRYLKKAESSENPAEKAMAQYALSQLYQLSGDHAKAIEMLKGVIAKYPDKPILKTDLGVIYFNQGETDKAMELFQESRKEAPANTYTTLQLARVYEQKGEIDLAVKLYRQLLTSQPTYSRGHYSLGKALTKQGNEPEAHYQLGIHYWYEGDSKNAIFHLDKAIKTLAKDSAELMQAKDLLTRIKELNKKLGE